MCNKKIIIDHIEKILIIDSCLSYPGACFHLCQRAPREAYSSIFFWGGVDLWSAERWQTVCRTFINWPFFFDNQRTCY